MKRRRESATIDDLIFFFYIKLRLLRILNLIPSNSIPTAIAEGSENMGSEKNNVFRRIYSLNTNIR